MTFFVDPPIDMYLSIYKFIDISAKSVFPCSFEALIVRLSRKSLSSQK